MWVPGVLYIFFVYSFVHTIHYSTTPVFESSHHDWFSEAMLDSWQPVRKMNLVLEALELFSGVMLVSWGYVFFANFSLRLEATTLDGTPLGFSRTSCGEKGVFSPSLQKGAAFFRQKTTHLYTPWKSKLHHFF